MKSNFIYIAVAAFIGCGGSDIQDYASLDIPKDPCLNIENSTACKGCASVCDKLIENDSCHVYDTGQACCPRDYRYCMASCMGGSCSFTFEYLAVFDCRDTAAYGKCE